jgi:membrane protein implicated in regulation of membrane protease activity
MANSTIWWLLAGTAVAVELVTGTFYLLMLAIGLAAGALTAYAGAPAVFQILAAAVVGGSSVVGWSYYRKRTHPEDPCVGGDRNVNLDVGETVHIERWNPDGTATVKYRGASWTAVHREGSIPVAGPHRVAELIGSRLLVDPL